MLVTPKPLTFGLKTLQNKVFQGGTRMFEGGTRISNLAELNFGAGEVKLAKCLKIRGLGPKSLTS